MTDVHQDNPTVHHEKSDVNVAGLFGFAGGLALALMFIGFAVWVLFQFYLGRETRQPPAEFPLASQQQNRLPPEPRLQTNPRQDLSDLRSQEDQILNSYGWVDKNGGVARIPIDEAMKLTVQRGLPARRGQQ